MAPVAQLDRALGYGPGGSGSNPSRRTKRIIYEFKKAVIVFYIGIFYNFIINFYSIVILNRHNSV